MNETYIPDWAILKAMDFGNDMPDEEPEGEDNFNFDDRKACGVSGKHIPHWRGRPVFDVRNDTKNIELCQ